MSFEALAWAWKQKTGSAGRKAVLSALAQFCDDVGECFPSQELIAEYTEQSPRTVRAHLEYLEAHGFIFRHARRRQDGTRTSDHFKLNLEKPAAVFKTRRQNRQNSLRKFLPHAPVSSGEKLQKPAAKIAAQESVTKNLKQSLISISARENENFDAMKALCSEGVSQRVARDFLAQRQRRGGTFTETALRSFKEQAVAAGYTLEQVLVECVTRNWMGFKASWVKSNGRGRDHHPHSVKVPAAAINALPKSYGKSGRL